MPTALTALPPPHLELIEHRQLLPSGEDLLLELRPVADGDQRADGVDAAQQLRVALTNVIYMHVCMHALRGLHTPHAPRPAPHAPSHPRTTLIPSRPPSRRLGRWP